MSSLDEALLKIKQGDVNCLSYEEVVACPIMTTLDMTDPKIAYLSGMEQVKLECGEMIARAQAGGGMTKLQEAIGTINIQSVAIDTLANEVKSLKEQLASKPDESSLVRMCRCIVEYNEPSAIKLPVRHPKIRSDMYRKMKEALDTKTDKLATAREEWYQKRCKAKHFNGEYKEGLVVAVSLKDKGSETFVDLVVLFEGKYKYMNGRPNLEVFHIEKDNGLGEPVNFFPDCRHRSMEGTVAKCGYQKGEHYGKPCSKRCLTPDQHKTLECDTCELRPIEGVCKNCNKRNGLISMPKKYQGKFHNACTDACDMIIGPCACGAWHHIEDWKGKIFYVKSNGLDNICPKCNRHGFQFDARASSTKLEIYICLYKNCQHVEKINV